MESLIIENFTRCVKIFQANLKEGKIMDGEINNKKNKYNISFINKIKSFKKRSL